MTDEEVDARIQWFLAEHQGQIAGKYLEPVEGGPAVDAVRVEFLFDIRSNNWGAYEYTSFSTAELLANLDREDIREEFPEYVEGTKALIAGIPEGFFLVILLGPGLGEHYYMQIPTERPGRQPPQGTGTTDQERIMKSESQQGFAFNKSDEGGWVYTYSHSPHRPNTLHAHLTYHQQWYAHAILKVVSRRITVSRESAPASWVVAAREDREYVGDVLHLDRQQFESQGWARHGHYRESAFYRRVGMDRVFSLDDMAGERRAEKAKLAEDESRRKMKDVFDRLRGMVNGEESPRDAAATLGLSWPCTEDEVKVAYRRL